MNLWNMCEIDFVSTSNRCQQFEIFKKNFQTKVLKFAIQYFLGIQLFLIEGKPTSRRPPTLS